MPTNAERARGPSLTSDLILGSLATALLAVVVWVIFADVGVVHAAAPEDPVATISRTLGVSQRRPAQSIIWDRVSAGAGLGAGDSIYVASDSEVVLDFPDGSTLTLDENSLIVVERVPDPAASSDPDASPVIAVNLKRGGISAAIAKTEIRIRAGSTVTRLEAGSRTALRTTGKGAEVYVRGGSATVETSQGEVELGENELLAVGEDGAQERTTISIALGTPAADQRVYLTPGHDRARFSWTPVGEVKRFAFELSSKSDFASVHRRLETNRSSIEVSLPGPGVYHWRVAGLGTGVQAVSENRRLTVVRDLAPMLLRPRPAEVVYAPAGGMLGFSWTEVGFAPGYRLVVSHDPAGKDVVIDEIRQEEFYRQPVEALAEGIYYWRVALSDPQRDATPSSRVSRFRLITRPLPVPPRLFDPRLLLGEEAAPPEEEKGTWLRLIFGPALAHAAPPKTTQMLRWGPVPGIEEYELEIAEDRQFEKVVATKRVKATFLRWKPPFLERDYWFRVRSIDSEGRVGENSKTKLIPAPSKGPAPLAPASGTRIEVAEAVSAVELRWAFGPGKKYQVQIAMNAAFTVGLVTKEVRKGGSLRWTPPGPGIYHWQVRSFDAAGRTSVFGATAMFDVRVTAPDGLKPAAGRVEVGRSINLSWKPRVASTFEVELSSHKKFKRGVKKVGAPDPRIGRRPIAVGTVHWRVRAVDPLGRKTAWSETARFRVTEGGLQLVTPPEDAQLEPGPVVLIWDAAPGAVSYVVVVTPVGAAATEQVSTETKLELAGLAPGSYRWKVRGLGRDGKDVARSDELGFEIVAEVALSTTTLLRPASAEVLAGGPDPISVAFGWSASPDAEAYDLQVSPTESFGEGTRDASAKDAETSLRGFRAGTYFWRVRARRGENSSEWSTPWRFEMRVETVLPPPTPKPGRMAVGVLAGGVFNLRDAVSFQATVELAWTPGLLERRLALRVLPGYSLVRQTYPGPFGLTATSTLHRFPLSLLVSYRFGHGRVVPYASVGPAIEIFTARTSLLGNASSEQGLLGGAAAAVGIDTSLGPGRAGIELQFTQLGRGGQRVLVGGSWLTLQVGYRFTLGKAAR